MRFDDLAKYIGHRPFLRNFVYLAIRLTTLREWYIAKGLSKLTKIHGKDFHFLDAGCGIGQHVVRLAKKFPNAQISGVEVDDYKVKDLADFTAKSNLRNCTITTGDITKVEFQKEYDIILCNSVLEHIHDDQKALEKLYEAMNENGHILIYVPIQEKRVLKSLEKIQKEQLLDSSTDLLHDHERYYQPAELSGKMQKTGFSIEQIIITYGFFGRIAYDLVTFVQYHRWVKLIFPFYLILVHPFVLIMMLFDFYHNNTHGNGLMVIAQKK